MNTWFIQGLLSTPMTVLSPSYLPPPCSMSPLAPTTGPQLHYRSKSPVQRRCLWSKQTFQLGDSPVGSGSALGAGRRSRFHRCPQQSYWCQACFQLSALAASNWAILEWVTWGEKGGQVALILVPLEGAWTWGREPTSYITSLYLLCVWLFSG